MSRAKFNIWSWDPSNRQWLEVAPGLTLREAEDALEQRHASADKAGVPTAWFLALPVRERPQVAPTPDTYPSPPAATTPEPEPEPELPRMSLGGRAELPEWLPNYPATYNYDRRAEHLTELAMDAARDAPPEMRAMVYAQLATAERVAEQTATLDMRLSDIRAAIEQ